MSSLDKGGKGNSFNELPNEQLDHIQQDALDADDLIEAEHRERYAAMVCSGTHTQEDIDQLIARKRYKQEIHLCKEMIKGRLWEYDPACTRKGTYLCYAVALNGINRRPEAIICLQKALLESDGDDEEAEGKADEACVGDGDRASLALALAKLLFQDLRKQDAIALCIEVYNNKTATSTELAEAYQLAGWIKIHSDDHTGAYEIWTQGHLACPSDSFLSRQYSKRACWDAYYQSNNRNNKNKNKNTPPPQPQQQREEDKNICISHKLLDVDVDVDVCMNAATATGTVFNMSQNDLNAYQVPSEQRNATSALALFHSTTQYNNLVFTTKQPVMTKEECKNVLNIVEEYHMKERNGKWGTVRTSSVKTTDVAVEDMPILRAWLRVVVETRLWPMLHAAYPMLADGTSLLTTTGVEEDEEDGEDEERRGGEWRLRLHDAFIVRYDATKDFSYSLPEHRDTSSMSFTLSLNEGDGIDYSGGGTWFEALGPQGKVVNQNIGHATAFAGPMRHAGFPIASGTRMILVLFCYIEGFHYGPLVDAWQKKHQDCQPRCRSTAPITRTSNNSSNNSSNDAEVTGSGVFAGIVGKKTGITLITPATAAATATGTGTGTGTDTSISPYTHNTHAQVRPSGDTAGGYVIYQQTTDLVEMLNRDVVSVLE